MEERPVDRLLLALREHDLPFTRDDVQWAFDSPQTSASVTQWVDQYLGPETLLSKEELETYLRLEQSGAVKSILASNDFPTVRPVLDDELRSAIETLNASTAAIERQNEILKKQQELLDTFKVQNRESRAACSHSNAQRRRKHAIESQQIALACDELAQNVASQLHSMQQQMKSSSAQLSPAIAETLRTDDRLLARLERLASELDVSREDTDTEEEQQRISQLGKRAAGLSAEEVRVHLDRVYLETLVECATERGDEPQNQNNDPVSRDVEDQAEIDAIKAELNSLYQEIAALTEIAVHENYLRPIFDEIREKNKVKRQILEDGLDYISSSLEYLIIKLEAITKNTSLHRAHHAALLTIAAQAEPQIKEVPQKRIISSSPQKQNSRREILHRCASSAAAQSTPIKALGSRYNPRFVDNDNPSTPTGPSSLHTRTGSVGQVNDFETPGRSDAASTATAAMQQLFRRLGLHVSPELPPEQLVSALSTSLADRKISLRNHLFMSELSSSQALASSAAGSATTSHPVPSALARHLAAADVTDRIFLDAVYADSKHCNYTVVDDRAKAEIARLEQDVDLVGKGMAKLDLEGVVRKEQTARERFVERWAGL